MSSRGQKILAMLKGDTGKYYKSRNSWFIFLPKSKVSFLVHFVILLDSNIFLLIFVPFILLCRYMYILRPVQKLYRPIFFVLGKLQKIRESNGDFSSEVGGSETVKELIENDSPVNEKNEIPLENSKILLEGQTYENSLLADENVIFEEVANVYEVIELQGEAEVSVSKKPRIELEIGK